MVGGRLDGTVAQRKVRERPPSLVSTSMAESLPCLAAITAADGRQNRHRAIRRPLSVDGDHALARLGFLRVPCLPKIRSPLLNIPSFRARPVTVAV
jgi:hypothetical protein